MKKLSLTILGLLMATSVAAQICPLNGRPMEPKGVASLRTIEGLAILDNGRIKPLDTYSRNVLLQLSGKSSFDRKPAIHWLAKVLFSVGSTREDKVFLINNPEIPTALGFEVEKHRRYSFNQIETGYPKLFELAAAVQKIEAEKRTPVDTEILRLAENLKLYAKLSRSFSFAIPHPDFTITDADLLRELEFPKNLSQFSFLDIALRADRLYQSSQSLSKKPEAGWTQHDKEAAVLMTNVFQWSHIYHELPFTVIPAYEKDNENWLSPWDTITNALQTENGREEISNLAKLVAAYWNGQQLEFDLAGRQFADSIAKRVGEKNIKGGGRIGLELIYNRLNLFTWAAFAYALALSIALLALLADKKIYYRLAWAFVLAGFGAHVAALAMRIAILGRPPVSSLYETFIFVGFIAALLGIVIERINKNWLGLIVTSFCGFVLLLIAGKFSAEGDTLKVLIAVLNSNFWLATHVTSITIGYAGCCVAGVIGHIYILQTIFKPHDKKLLNSTYRNLIAMLGFGLTMTFLGTNLGGIWADQSWGRFWGWDPKENGALLIIIWTAIIFHARVANLVGPLGVAVLSALGIVVVMWAWFGVNLLSVGLHSYGFTSGLALNLSLYLVAQVLFLAITVPICNKKLEKS